MYEFILVKSLVLRLDEKADTKRDKKNTRTVPFYSSTTIYLLLIIDVKTILIIDRSTVYRDQI